MKNLINVLSLYDEWVNTSVLENENIIRKLKGLDPDMYIHPSWVSFTLKFHIYGLGFMYIHCSCNNIDIKIFKLELSGLYPKSFTKMDYDSLATKADKEKGILIANGDMITLISNSGILFAHSLKSDIGKFAVYEGSFAIVYE